MRALIAFLCLTAFADPTLVVLNLSKTNQHVTTELADAKEVRAVVTPGDSFPYALSAWRGPGYVEKIGGALPTYYKVTKGDLNAITLDKPAAVVYQMPVHVQNSGVAWTLVDMNIGTDFVLTQRGQSVQLAVVSWFQFPGGRRVRLTLPSLKREAKLIDKRYTLAKARAGNSANPKPSSARAKAERSRLEKALASLPLMFDLCEQLNEKADFEVQFFAGKGAGELIVKE